MKIDNSTAKKLKKDFPIFRNNPNLIYLDNAATSQRPERVIRAVTDFYEKENANPGRSLHTLAEKSMSRYNEARECVAKFIVGNKEEIVFTRNATEAINIVAHTIFPLISKGRDEILITEMEHHSNIVPWQQLASRHGFKIKVVKIRQNFTLDIADLREKIGKKTAIFAFTHTSNVLGTINPVEEMVQIAKEQGAMTLIDASQAVQHLEINVKKIGCDFLAFSSHKMLGPGGIGVLYGKKELLDKMHPHSFGGGMIKKVSWDQSEFAEVPERFEAGTQNIAEAVGLEESIKYLQELGLQNIKSWEDELVKYALVKINSIEGVKVYNPGAGKTGPLVSFSVDSIHPHDVAEILNRDGIAIRAGHQCAMPLMGVLAVDSKGGVCRASFSFYNTFEDVDALVLALAKIKEKLGK